MATIFRLDSKQLEKGLASLEIKQKTATRMVADNGAKKFENYAKKNRPWTDRTHRARDTLHGYVEQSLTKTRIYIAHGVDYGKWLELAHEKRYAIIPKTINKVSPEIIKGFQVLFDRMNK